MPLGFLRESFAAIFGSTISDTFKIASQGKTILVGMDDALVENMIRRLEPVMKFNQEQSLYIDNKAKKLANKAFENMFIKDADGKVYRKGADGNKLKDKNGEVEPALTEQEAKIAHSRLIGTHKSFNMLKVIEDKVDFYLNEIKGKPAEKMLTPEQMDNLIPHELEISTIETWRNNRGNVRMARGAINEMQTFSQAQNAMMSSLINTKLVSQKFRQYFEEMATVIDLFEPMSQQEADKYRMSNFKWDELAKEYEVELEKKYKSFSVNQQKMAVYLTTQSQSGWNEYLDLGANALHQGVGSVFANILQVRTFMMREIFEDVSLNLLRAYEKGEQIDIKRTAQATNFDSLIGKGRNKNWNARDYFEEKYGIKNPTPVTGRDENGNEIRKQATPEEIRDAMSQINKAMLVDATIDAANSQVLSTNSNRGWGLIESNRTFMHAMIKCRIDLHPAIAYRPDGDGLGKTGVETRRSPDEYKNFNKDEDAGRAPHDTRAGTSAVSEAGGKAFVKDIMDKITFINEHFTRSFFVQVAALKTGETAKSLFEQVFPMIDIQGLGHYDQYDSEHARKEFLRTNGYNVYDQVPESFKLPTAHRPHLDAPKALVDKIYLQMLMELPEMPATPGLSSPSAEKQQAAIDDIKDVHKRWKENYLRKNPNVPETIDIPYTEVKDLINKDGTDYTKNAEDKLRNANDNLEPAQRNSELYKLLPTKKVVLKFMQSTIDGMPWKDLATRAFDVSGGKSNRGVGSVVSDIIAKPSKETKMGRAYDKAIQEENDIREREADGNSKAGDKGKLIWAKTKQALTKWTIPVIAIGAVVGGVSAVAGTAAVATAGMFAAAGAAGLAVNHFVFKGLRKTIFEKLHDSKINRAAGRALSLGLGFSAALNTHQALSPDAAPLGPNFTNKLNEKLSDPDKIIKFASESDDKVSIPAGSPIMVNNKPLMALEDLKVHVSQGDTLIFDVTNDRLIGIKTNPKTSVIMTEEIKIPFKQGPNITIDGASRSY